MEKGTHQGQKELALGFLQGTKYEGMIVTGRSSGRKRETENYYTLLKYHPDPRYIEMSQLQSRTQEHGAGTNTFLCGGGGQLPRILADSSKKYQTEVLHNGSSTMDACGQ